ncbi:hypothetical protein GCM10022393_40410 [Aquimarina addita]|uniref:Phosphoribosylpyrophosphate synthetase n=1 Tax=Aquimarina addita TaxID=870485 RepID=A0ABP6UTB3_9FLAO
MILSSHKTLLEDIEAAKKAGFTADFLYKDNQIYDRETNKAYSIENCTLIEYCRHEGFNDPGDASILFLISCDDGIKGCLSSNYGVHADLNLMQFALSIKSEFNK